MKSFVLTVDDLAELVQQSGLNRLMDEMIDRLTAALRTYDDATYAAPPRAGFDYNHPHTGLLEWMPAIGPEQKITIKTVGYHPRNPTHYALPTILSTVTRFDACTGHLAAIVDATFLTALRTGAASAVASRVLAHPDSATLGLIGCGAQAVAQYHGLSRVFPIERVLLFDIEGVARSSFRDRCDAFLDGATDIEFQTVDVDEIVAKSDILCTATSVEVGQGPVFDDVRSKPWLHINAIGSDFPGKTEVPRSMLTRALVCPDFRVQAIHEGECQQLRSDEIGPDLVEILQHDDPFADHRDRLTVFDSTGWAVEDHIALDLLLDRARELGLGTEVPIESGSDDPTNPYGFANRLAVNTSCATLDPQ